MLLMWVGSEFQAAGTATVSDLVVVFVSFWLKCLRKRDDPLIYYSPTQCQTPSKTQTDKETNGQKPRIEFCAFSLKM